MEFLIVLGVIFTVFAGLIVWFMKHEENKAWSYHAERASNLSNLLIIADETIDTYRKANNSFANERDRLSKHATILANRITELGIGINDYLDQIAEAQGKRVTLKSWIAKTEAGKMAAILKKIEKL